MSIEFPTATPRPYSPAESKCVHRSLDPTHSCDELQRPELDGVHWMGDVYPANADPERDTWNGQLIKAIAADLYRDQVTIAGTLYRLRSAAPDLAQFAVIIAPRHDGQLNGGRFLGLPVMEGDVASCMVALASPGAPV